MRERHHEIQSWAWLIGGLLLVCSWLLGSLEANPLHAWNWKTIGCLCLTSICWGIYGWHNVSTASGTYENKAFMLALFAVLPWFIFAILMIAPYAAGARVWPE